MNQKSLFGEDDNEEEIKRLDARRKEKPPDGLTEGRKLRDEGIDRVLENAGDEWKAKVLGELIKLKGQTIKAEDLRRHCLAAGIFPHHPNAWGGFTQGLVKQGRLKKTGSYTQMTDPNSHGRETKIYLVC